MLILITLISFLILDGPIYKMIPWNLMIWNGGNFIFFLILKKCYEKIEKKLRSRTKESDSKNL